MFKITHWYRLLKSNYEVNEILLDEYRQYFHVKKSIKVFDNPPPITTNCDTVKIPGVFEKAKQFVCRVFGGGSSSTKRLIEDVNLEQKKFHSFQFEPTPLSSESYTSLITKSPPPSTPIHSTLTIDQITQTMNFIEHLNDGRGDTNGEYFDSLMSSDSSEDDDD